MDQRDSRPAARSPRQTALSEILARVASRTGGGAVYCAALTTKNLLESRFDRLDLDHPLVAHQDQKFLRLITRQY